MVCCDIFRTYSGPVDHAPLAVISPPWDGTPSHIERSLKEGTKMNIVAIKRGLAVAVLVALAVMGLVLAGCGSDEPADGADGEAQVVRIGFAAPLTGDNALYGLSMRNAALLAIDELNAMQETKDANITFELRAEDDAADPKVAVNVANILVGDPLVMGIVGHFNSSCSIPASAVYKDADLAMVTVSTNPDLTEAGLAGVNRITARDDSQGAAGAELVFGDGFKNIVVVDDSTTYGQGLAEQFTAAYTGLGGTVIESVQVQPKEVNFSSVVTKIKSTNPEAIYYAGAHTEGALFRKQLREGGVSVKLYGGEMIFTADYIELAAGAEGDVATVLGLPIDQQVGGPAFVEKFTAAYGAAPEAYDTYSYDSTMIFGKAILEAGSDRAAVQSAVRGISYQGVTGLIEFDAKGDNKEQVISAYEVKDGVWTIR